MIKASTAGLPLISIAMVNQRSPVIILSLKGSGITQAEGSGRQAPRRCVGRRGQQPVAGLRASQRHRRVQGQDGVAAARTEYPGPANKDVDAVATVYQSSVPYLLADNVPYDIMFFSAYGLDIYSLTFITPADRSRGRPQQVAAFVEGAMEGLKFSYLNPDKTLEDFVEAIPEAGKTERDRPITMASLLINTAEGLTEEVRRNGLGWHDEARIKRTLEIGDTYLKLPNIPAPERGLHQRLRRQREALRCRMGQDPRAGQGFPVRLTWEPLMRGVGQRRAVARASTPMWSSTA